MTNKTNATTTTYLRHVTLMIADRAAHQYRAMKAGERMREARRETEAEIRAAIQGVGR